MPYKRKTLSNGLRLILVPMSSFESATVMVMVGAGSRYEVPDNNGISHFLEHMAFKGTKNRPTAMDIASLIDGMGGEFNAFTGKETTGYYIKAASTHIDICLDVLSDMLKNSLFDPQEIEKEKGVILQEINLYEDTPARKIGELFEHLLYKNEPMGWDIGGRKEVIKKITRDDFTQYLNQLYSPKNITVVVSGGLDEQKVIEQVEAYFGDMMPSDTIGYEEVVEDQKKPEVLVKKKKTEQVHIALGFRTVGINHKDRYTLDVISAILGGGMSSRLFNEVREKRGLAYYVRTSSDNYLDCGSLVSLAGVDPKRSEEAVSVMRQEYEKLFSKETAVTDEELRKAKEYLKGHLVLELEDSRSVASFYAYQELLEERLETPGEVLKNIEKITLDDVHTIAQKYIIPSQINLAVIGDFDGSQNFKKLLE